MSSDRLPVRKMNPVHGGTWAGIDVEALLMYRESHARMYEDIYEVISGYDKYDSDASRRLGIDVASIRRLAGEGE